MAEQKPSIGRIVIYNHPGSSDGNHPAQKSPAIIQHVAGDGTVRLFVFGGQKVNTWTISSSKAMGRASGIGQSASDSATWRCNCVNFAILIVSDHSLYRFRVL